MTTPGGRAERDAFDAWHSERLRQLASVEDRLAFGRLDLAGGERRYIGRIGLSDGDQSQLLVDWRAPAAASFYQATAAAPDGVARRRHLATRNRTVIGIDDELLDADALEAGELTVTGEGALMSALTAHRTGRMRDIVATLQAEQDAVVRAPLAGVLVVQGGPGTGKTAVALHRAAYLLYTHRERISRSGVLVVGPSRVFLSYIEQVLPSLGETGVVLATPAQLYPGVEAGGSEEPAVSVLKGDLRMARLVRAAVRRRQRTLAGPVQLLLDGTGVQLTPRAVAEARSRARQTGRPHNEARVTFVKHVLDDLAAQLAAARGIELNDDSRADLLAELRDSRDVRREVNLCWMPLTPEKLIADLFALPTRLADAAAGLLDAQEQALLRRERDAPWTPADVPLLDEAAELIGPDVSADAAARAREAADRAEALEHARAVLATSPQAAAMVTAEMLADRFADPGPVASVSERAMADRAWTYGHAVVDEAQELSPMTWRLIMRRVPSRSMTVVGDVAQTGSAAGTTSWARVLDPHAGERWRLAELSVNYRTPAAVMELAGSMLGAAGVPVRIPRSARAGAWPPSAARLAGRDITAVAAAAAAALAGHDAALLAGGQHAATGPRHALIVPRSGYPGVAEEVRAALTAGSHGADGGGADGLAGRVDVLTVEEVKGLEFDGVVVLDPGAIVAQSQRGPNDLYVALTRPTQRLAVLHHGDLPAGMGQLEGAGE